MYDQVLDNFRKAAESTAQLQQEMFRNWTQQWAQVPTATVPTGANFNMHWFDQIHALQRTWFNNVSDMLNKHREMLDKQYQAGIKTIEEAFRVGEARDPEHFRRLTEALWKQNFETLKTLSETQVRDFQNASEKWMEAMTKGMQQATKT